MTKRRRFSLSTTQIILLSFLAVIFIGSLLLSLPVSSATRVPVAYVDALFTATTATCVTGLVTVPTATAWSVFGQAVILGLIQIGGLGVITVLTAAMLLINRKIGLSGRLLIQDAFNLNTLSGIAAFVKKVLAGTLIVEAAGALLNLGRGVFGSPCFTAFRPFVMPEWISLGKPACAVMPIGRFS